MKTRLVRIGNSRGVRLAKRSSGRPAMCLELSALMFAEASPCPPYFVAASRPLISVGSIRKVNRRSGVGSCSVNAPGISVRIAVTA